MSNYPKNKKPLLDTRSMVTVALLVAMEIILSRFLSFSIWNMKIGLNFIPVVLAAIMFGPLQAGIVGALGDFIGAILFPIGTYFPGFTLSAFLMGVVFGLLLHKKQTLQRVLGAVGLNQLVLSLLLNTLWVSVLYGSPYSALLATRILQTLVLIPVQIGVVLLIKQVSKRFGSRKAIA